MCVTFEIETRTGQRVDCNFTFTAASFEISFRKTVSRCSEDVLGPVLSK
jgi:hypothetical protein